MIFPKNSNLCGMCSRVTDCPCECHFSNVVNGYHEHIFSTPTSIKVRKEGKGPERADFILMRLGKMPKTFKYKYREIFRKMSKF